MMPNRNEQSVRTLTYEAGSPTAYQSQIKILGKVYMYIYFRMLN